MKSKPRNPEDDIPYLSDPEFRPHPPAAPVAGPGQALAPQEREIVRRLILIAERRPELAPEELERCLPAGVGLSNDQRQLLSGLLNGPRGPDRDAIAALWRQDYSVTPPSIEQFVDDDFYLGQVLRRTSTNPGLWPAWRRWLVANANLNSFLNCVVLSGAIGIGKTFLMVILILYRIAQTSMLRDPFSFYDLAPGSAIDFLLLSLSRETVQATAWATALQLMDKSAFFRHHCGYDPKAAHARLEVVLRVRGADAGEFGIKLSGGSKTQHQIGKNVLAVGLDEGNFRLESDPQKYAANLYHDLTSRIDSRFKYVGAFNPGLTVVASSAAELSCFTEKLIEQIERSGDPNGQTVICKPIYELKPTIRIRSWRFKVWYGRLNDEPAIAPGCFDEKGDAIAPPAECPPHLAQAHQPPPPGAKSELVPGDLYEEFVRSPRKALQQRSGISLGAVNRLFPSLADVQRCLELSEQDGVRAPTLTKVLLVSNQDDHVIRQDLLPSIFVRPAGPRVAEPVRHPQRLRYAHLDLATTGLAGLAICHLADIAVASAGPGGTPKFRLIVEYDFILTLSGGGDHRPLSYQKIVDFIWWLRDDCGFRFGLITTDMYQSDYLRQTLEAKHFPTAHQSVDRNKGVYQAWLAGFQEHTIRLYPQEQLLEEASKLIENQKKIDHPVGGSKDTTDAAAGAYFNAIHSTEIEMLGSPPGPSAVLGISCNGPAEDMFNFFGHVKPRPVRVFKA